MDYWLCNTHLLYVGVTVKAHSTRACLHVQICVKASESFGSSQNKPNLSKLGQSHKHNPTCFKQFPGTFPNSFMQPAPGKEDALHTR